MSATTNHIDEPVPPIFNISPEETQKLAEDIASRCMQHDPAELLGRMAWDVWQKPVADSNPAALEYVHHLYLSLPASTEYVALDDESYAQIQKKLVDLFFDVTFLRKANSSGKLGRLASSVHTDALFVRGKSFPCHQFGYLEGLFALVEDWLEEKLGVKPHGIACMLKWLYSEVSVGVSHLEMQAEKDTAGLRYSEAFRLSDPPVEFASLVKLLAASPGGNLTNSVPLPDVHSSPRDYPFLKIDGAYYCFNNQPVIDELPRILNDWLKEKDAKRFNAFTKRRETYATTIALEALSKSLRGAEYHQNLYYQHEDKRREIDGLLVFHDMAIVMQTKGGAFSRRARAGYDERIARDFHALVNEAFEQACCDACYLNSASEVTLYDLQGTEVLKIKRPRHILKICLVLDAIDPLATDLKEAQERGLLNGLDEFPWVVTLNDLRTVTDTLDTPTEFLLYVARRVRANHHSEWFSVHDELDYLGYFLETGLWLETKPPEMKDAGIFVYQYDIKPVAHYLASRFLGRPATKPSPPFNLDLLKLIRDIENSGIEGWIPITTELLGLNGQCHKQLMDNLIEAEERLQRRNRAQCPLYVRDTLGITMWVTDRYSSKLREQFSFEDELRKYEKKCDVWFTLVLQINGESRTAVDLWQNQNPWQFDPALEDTVSDMRDIKLQINQPTGKIGRNDPCPCRSGKKYKKCHGRSL